MQLKKLNPVFAVTLILFLATYATIAKANFYNSGVVYSSNCDDIKADSISFDGGQIDSAPVIKHKYSYKQGYKSTIFEEHRSNVDPKTEATDLTLISSVGSESYNFTEDGKVTLVKTSARTKSNTNVLDEAFAISPVFSTCKFDSAAAKVMSALVIANRKVHGESIDGLTDNPGHFEPNKIAKILKSQNEEWKREESEERKQQALKAKEDARRAKQEALEAAKNPKTYELEKTMDSCKKIDGWTTASKEAVARKMESSVQSVSLLRGEWDAYTKVCVAMVDTAKGPKKFLIHRILTSDNGKTSFVVLESFGNATFGW